MKFDVPREAWQDPRYPVVSSSRFPDWSKIERIVIHGTGVFNLNPDDPAAILRSTQRFYHDQRGYSIGYNGGAGVDRRTYELRGDDFMCAANVKVNPTTFAILLIIPSGVPAPPPVLDAARAMIAEARVLAGWDLPIVPHSAVGATDCPTDPVRAQIAAGEFEPRPSLPMPVLKLRDRGDRVRVLRDHLVFWGHQKRSGVFFGTGTRAAVRRWQRALGVPTTGRYDIATYDAYRKSVGL